MANGGPLPVSAELGIKPVAAAKLPDPGNIVLAKK